MDKRRNSFLTYAKQHNFDPLVPENWYNVVASDLSHLKAFIFADLCLIVNYLLQDCVYILHLYKDNVRHALLSLFPEIGLDPENFKYSYSMQSCLLMRN